MEDILNLEPNSVISENQQWVLKLPAWVGFQNRGGAYGSKIADAENNVGARVTINGLMSTAGITIISVAQVNTIKYLAHNDVAVRDAILNALLKDYPNAKEIYEEYMPPIASKEQYKDFIGLSYIHIMNAEREGFCYLGFELGCDWDDEHGLGLMVH